MIVRHCPSRLMVLRPSVFAIRPTCCPLAVGITTSRKISRTSDFILRLVQEISTPVVSPRGSSELFWHLTGALPFPGTDTSSPGSHVRETGEERQKQSLWTRTDYQRISEVQFEAKLNIARRTRGADGTKPPIREHRGRRPEVCTIEGIEHVSLETESKSLSKPELLAK